ncbi:AraC family transcriptional regulator [Chengkuizengella axinellae]|uniref:Helix-turn-helix domain-containing protein n=1 Tax=Chengkuizengella axinellae TaxID=3064388 RepID=A0ABT9IU70_9BACL|nr:GyrI-like domain-containing protein [Chengkuizengella sp. 2205SS18-9]MDP5272896.1 helix-turn-helix domain-containing protein [Chengkuizengella sp. 2205SS18-9]
MKRNDYLMRMNKVIDYIQHHPDSDLSLQKLAQLASFSPFHFHRIFKAILNENVNDYVKRSRLERAAKKLMMNQHLSVTEVALDMGFSSSAVFSRAFKEFFGMSASEYKKVYNRKICKRESRNCKETPHDDRYDDISEAAAKLVNENKRRKIEMNIEVKILPNYYIAYVRHLQGYEKGIYNHEISEAFNKAASWVNAHQLFDQNTICMGVFYDFQDITPSEKRRYDAAFTIPEHVTTASTGIGIQDIKGGQYACSRIEVKNTNEEAFERAIEEMDRAFDFIYGTWLPDSMYELEDKPNLEFYLTPKDSEMIAIEAYVPVKPL